MSLSRDDDDARQSETVSCSRDQLSLQPRAPTSRTSTGRRRAARRALGRRYGVLPLREEEGALVVATSDALDLDAERAIGFATGRRVRWVEATHEEIEAQLARWYADGLRSELSAPPVEVQHIGFAAGTAASGAERRCRLGDPARRSAPRRGNPGGASDIHIEPEEEGSPSAIGSTACSARRDCSPARSARRSRRA
jgi:type II secretory ATPase GspE/PulE/Tfp pilus assembly ATPase PilB-like protein